MLGQVHRGLYLEAQRGPLSCTVDCVPLDFSLEEAREVLAAVQSVAPNALRVPFSNADCITLLEAGIEIKDPTRGLVDFPTVIDGAPAYWCWLAGEPEIAWWHPRNGGFAARKPISG